MSCEWGEAKMMIPMASRMLFLVTVKSSWLLQLPCEMPQKSETEESKQSVEPIMIWKKSSRCGANATSKAPARTLSVAHIWKRIKVVFLLLNIIIDSLRLAFG